MSDEPRNEPDARAELEEEEEGPPTTPFDHPAFLPVLLIGFTIWFGYDGWFNPDMEWVKFNRYGFGFLLPPTLYSTLQAVRGPVPQLLPAVYGCYVLWLGYMGWLGAEGSWFNDTDTALQFNRWSCGAAALMTVYSVFRARSRAAAGDESGSAAQ